MPVFSAGTEGLGPKEMQRLARVREVFWQAGLLAECLLVTVRDTEFFTSFI